MSYRTDTFTRWARSRGAHERSRRQRALVERVDELEQARQEWLASDEWLAWQRSVYDRWLDRQTLDHPWRVAREKGAA